MYKIHELATLPPLANEKEQLALTESIKEIGQQLPALLWKGEIVDGRCRQIACTTLGIPLKVEHLPDDMSYDEVYKRVTAYFTHRNLTTTQKAIMAHRVYVEEKKQGKVTLKDVAKRMAVSVDSINAIISISKIAPRHLNELYNGKSVSVYNPFTGKYVTTDNINTIDRYLREELRISEKITAKRESVRKWGEFLEESSFINEDAYEWCLLELDKILTDKERTVKSIIELANLKFAS